MHGAMRPNCDGLVIEENKSSPLLILCVYISFALLEVVQKDLIQSAFGQRFVLSAICSHEREVLLIFAQIIQHMIR